MESKWEGTFVIKIESGKNLLNADFMGTSDPYCIIHILSASGESLYKANTNTIEDNLNPIFKASFVKYLAGSGPVKIVIEVFDEDNIGEDDFLGMVTHTITPTSAHSDNNYTTELRTKKGELKKLGHLNYSINWIPDFEAPLQQTSVTPVHSLDGKPFKTVLGPVLLFRGTDTQKDLYKLAVTILVDGEGGESPLFSLNVPAAEGVDIAHLLTFKTYNLWRYSFAVQRSASRITLKYTLNEKEYEVEVPAIGEPLRSLFVSCNGFHETPEDPKYVKNSHVMWDLIIKNHREGKASKGGYHLIIQGGDQVYADPIFGKVDLLQGVLAGDLKAIKLVPNLTFHDQVETFYMELYINSWSNPSLAEAYASIPSVMMWDDHDIFDGWGSYDAELMSSPTYSYIGNIADKYFCAFQLGATQDELKHKSLFSALQGDHSGKTQVFKIDRTGIVCLDLRSERTKDSVCSPATYNNFIKWTQDNSDIEQLLLVLSIPIVYNDFDVLEKAIESTGLGKELEDDLKDHWRTKDHRHERLDLLKSVIDASVKGKFRTTILSGDVHIACAGIIYDKIRKRQSNAAVVYSLISSAVVNVPPPETVVNVLELTGNEIESVTVEEGWNMRAGLIRFFHDSRKSRYIPGRNFLELCFNSKHGILASWYAEGHEEYPFELYIAPYKDGKTLDFKLVQEDWKYITQTLGSMIGLPKKEVVSGWSKAKAKKK